MRSGSVWMTESISDVISTCSSSLLNSAAFYVVIPLLVQSWITEDGDDAWPLFYQSSINVKPPRSSLRKNVRDAPEINVNVPR